MKKRKNTTAPAPVRTMYHATLETMSHFFDGYGSTMIEAMTALGHAIDAHGSSCGLDPDWADQYADAIRCRRVELGRGYRDGIGFAK